MFFLCTLFLKNEEQPSKKTSEKCFAGKMKPTCQNSAIFSTFKNGRKILGAFLPAAVQLHLNSLVYARNLFGIFLESLR